LETLGPSPLGLAGAWVTLRNTLLSTWGHNGAGAYELSGERAPHF